MTHDLSALRTRLTVKLPEQTYTFSEPTLGQIAALLDAARPGASAPEMAAQLRTALRELVPDLTAKDAEHLLTPRVFEAFLALISGRTPAAASGAGAANPR